MLKNIISTITSNLGSAVEKPVSRTKAATANVVDNAKSLHRAIAEGLAFTPTSRLCPSQI